MCHVLNPHPLFQSPSISNSLGATNAFLVTQQPWNFGFQHGFQEGFNAGIQTLSGTDNNQGNNMQGKNKEGKGGDSKAPVELVEKTQAEIDRLRDQLIVLQQTYDKLVPRVSHAATRGRGKKGSAGKKSNLRITLPEVAEHIRPSSSKGANNDSSTGISNLDLDESFHYIYQTTRADNNKNDDQEIDGGFKEETEREETSNGSEELVVDSKPARVSDKVSPSTSRSRRKTAQLDKRKDPPSPPSSPPQPQSEVLGSSVGEIRESMDSAHRAEEEALAWLEPLLSEVDTTPPAAQTEVQTVFSEQRSESQTLDIIEGPSVAPSASLEHVYVSASDIGIGFVFNEQWEAWRLRKGWQKGGWKQGKFCDFQWTEAVAVELGVRVMIKAGYAGKEITICSDNLQVAQAFSEGREIEEPPAQEVLDNTKRLCRQLKISLKVLWNQGMENPADQVSVLDVGSATARFPCHVEIPPFLQDVVVPFYQ